MSSAHSSAKASSNALRVRTQSGHFQPPSPLAAPPARETAAVALHRRCHRAGHRKHTRTSSSSAAASSPHLVHIVFLPDVPWRSAARYGRRSARCTRFVVRPVRISRSRYTDPVPRDTSASMRIGPSERSGFDGVGLRRQTISPTVKCSTLCFGMLAFCVACALSSSMPAYIVHASLMTILCHAA